MEDAQGLTITSLLLMAIIESGNAEDMKRAAASVADFPQDLAAKYWNESIRLAEIFADVKKEG